MSDTWEWDGRNWTEVKASGPPKSVVRFDDAFCNRQAHARTRKAPGAENPDCWRKYESRDLRVNTWRHCPAKGKRLRSPRAHQLQPQADRL